MALLTPTHPIDPDLRRAGWEAARPITIGDNVWLGGGAIDAGLNSYVALAHSPRLLSWLHACFGIGAASGPAMRPPIP